MKRSLALVALAALVATSHQASAAPKRKPLPPKPIAHTFYFHGTQPNGNVELNAGEASSLTMDTVKPTGAETKEIAAFGGGVTPNSECAGSSLLPSWAGKATGTLSGKVTVNFYARSTPGTVIVKVFNVGGGACNEAYPGSLAEAVVDVPAGAEAKLLTATLTVAKPAKLVGDIIVQIQQGVTAGALQGPQVTGISYDSTTAPSAVTFFCTPKVVRAKTC